MRRVILLAIPLTLMMASVNAVLATGDAAGDMASDLICPCECTMIISTCDCPTAEQVKKEMEHIPRGSYLQNMLRLYYQPLRMNSLGKKAQMNATKEDILSQSIDAVQKEYPEFVPQYNAKFFIVKK